MSDRIQNLVDLGKLAREPAGDDEIVGLWSNALQAFADALVSGLSASGRLVRAYDAGRIAAMAVVRSRDLRVRAANHHEMTLAVARLIGGPELGQAVADLDGFRTRRTEVEYGWQVAVSAEDAERATEVARRVLRHGAIDLREHRTTLVNRIEPPG
ncbi:hypothetical protein [Longimicrobium sp.]|uniref:hypothetical protein n=1 Tax=Longimicrobium sp. TaxID=2029185 RepID=UPI002E31D093|nr:hypothetical protein [Longimicrobium sp.]HEX6039337.1 hypothetical protein [Longimicrobium sp.]